MKIAITGSSGLIGTALKEHLTASGHDVMPVRRGNREDPSALWDPDAGWFRDGALEGVNAVVHLAGADIGDKRWTEERKRELVESRTKGTRLLVDHLRSLAAPPRVLVSASAVGIYGTRGDARLTEESSRGKGFLADLAAAWEEEASRATEAGMRVAMLRFAPVLSARGGALKKMLLPFQLGVGGRIGSGKAWFPWVSLPDAISAYECALTSDLSGPVNVAAPQQLTNAEYTKALGKALHRPTLLPIPPFALKLLYGGELVDEMLLASQRVVPAKLTAAGFSFEHPEIDGALEAALRKDQR